MKKKITKKKKIYNKYNFKKLYNLIDSINILKKINLLNFNPSLNLSINLNNKSKIIYNFKKILILPFSNGKRLKILALVNDDIKEKIKKLGADYVGGIEYINKIEEEKWLKFDIIITNKYYMEKLLKLGKLLSSKNLMPSYENGNIIENTEIEKTIKYIIDSRRIIITPDKYNIIHLVIGKISFKSLEIIENIKYIIKEIKKIKYNNKNILLKDIYLNFTMGPSLKIKI
ncbi:MAG: hypothetical protein NHF85_00360 [Candidatus Shikimatogenerans sp. JK-2022]|nr:hypothetical protein [Candidatus Shikimatogenerans bostrichidophilus]